MHRLCDSRLPVRDPADHPVRRRLVPQLVPAARADLRRLGAIPWYWKIIDYFWHITLPLIAMALGAFATMTLLTKNSFLDEIRKQYVMTARAKGCSEDAGCSYGHIFRNAMLIVIAGFPERVHSRLLLRFAADRDHLLARRPRPARLRERARTATIPVGVRHAVHLFAGRSGGQPDLRPRLHVDRSADRLRGAGGLMTTHRPPADRDHDASRRSATARARSRAMPFSRRRSTGGAGRISRRTGAATGRSGSSSVLFVVSLFAKFIANDRPLLVKYDGHLYWPVLRQLFRDDLRRRFRDRGRLSRSLSAEADRGEGRHHRSGRRSAIPTTPTISTCRRRRRRSRPGC